MNNNDLTNLITHNLIGCKVWCMIMRCALLIYIGTEEPILFYNIDLSLFEVLLAGVCMDHVQ